MRIRNILAAAIVALSSGVSTLTLAGPAQGQAAEPCPPGQPPGRPPGNPNPGPPPGRPPQYPPGKCQLQLSRSVVAAGGSLEAAGAGFAPGSPVEVTLSGASLASPTASSGGAFDTTLVVPASTDPGVHTVTASGPAAGGGTQVLSAALTVTAAETAARSGRSNGQAVAGDNLPRTGSSSPLPLSLAGGALLAVGLATVVLARRRADAGGA